VDLAAGGVTRSLSSRVEGLGDILLMPVMTSYAPARDLHLDFRGVVYAPTGDFQMGRPANPGKNHWTVAPVLGVLYFGRQNGLEVSVFTGVDFNSENPDTEYRSGTQFHVDGTLAWHRRVAGGIAGVGLSGFWYDQLTGDSGSGAKHGAHQAHTEGLGPVLSYMRKVAGKDLAVELKWLRELDTVNRLEGEYLWLKVVLRF
jgi:hypothetical protein